MVRTVPFSALGRSICEEWLTFAKLFEKRFIKSLNHNATFIELLCELCLRLLDSPLLCKVQFPEDLGEAPSYKVCASAHRR